MHWHTYDKDILLAANKEGITVAHKLAKWSHKTGWTTDDPEVLAATDNDGITVEDMLKGSS